MSKVDHCGRPPIFKLSSRLCIFLWVLLVPNSMTTAQNFASHAPWRASWIAAGDAPPHAAGVFHFRKSFDLVRKPAHLMVRVSADNRYRLFANGVLVSSGPARGDLSHWRYETVDLAPYLHLGRNVLAALVWNWGEYRPVAQISFRTGFLLSGDDDRVDTNASWKVLWDRAYSFTPVTAPDDGGYYAASPGENVDSRLYPWGWESPAFDDSGWPAATVLAAPARPRASDPHGVADVWQLVPRNIPPMEERPVSFARVRRAEGVAPEAGFISGGRGLVIPAHRRVSLLLDQDHLTTGYPVLVTSGGAGATAMITYAEALFDAQGRKGNRDQIEGRTIRGLRDRITFDGGEGRRFQSLWLRTFRYVQLDVATGDTPIEISDFHSIFSAYPFENHAAFSSDESWIDGIWDIDWRMLRLSAFETFWDTPYYEQLQYVGDTRIEALISLYNAGDDRLMRNAIELFDESRSAEGITGSRYPSDPAQYIPPFSLWWVAMVHDYWMLRDDPAFVRRFLPGMRGVLAWYERHLDQTDMLGPLPWWNFLDWTDAFDRGVPPGAEDGHSTAFTLQFAYALQMTAEIEAAIGQPDAGTRDRVLADRLIAAVRKRSWNEARGLFSDSLEKQSFSQQTNALAVLTGAARDRRAVTERLLSDPGIVQASYYFRFYVDEAMRASGLADRYLSRLEPWREMIRNGLTTTPETPEPSRSDSHAWSAHPNYHLLATVLGVRPASPGFRSVAIAPALGPLRRVEGRVPHPDGKIEISLERVGAKGIAGVITLPPKVSGSFLWAGETIPLRAGRNAIRIAGPV